jgi:hypothetical protein
MDFPLALFDFRAVLSAPAGIIPVAGGVVTGFAVALFRGRLGRLFLHGDKDLESVMNFASMGTLRCICGEKHPAGVAVDRRQFCRSCGCEVMAVNTTQLDRHLSQKEIKAMTESLRRTAIRASHLELPPTIASIDELHRYLDSSEPKNSRTSPTQPMQPGQVKQPQVH